MSAMHQPTSQGAELEALACGAVDAAESAHDAEIREEFLRQFGKASRPDATPAAPPADNHGELGTWIVVPTYNEVENLDVLVAGIFELKLRATLVLVDDNSPDGTGYLADSLAASNPNIHVIHRDSKQGLGAAYVAGFDYALAQGADVIVQMDADGSHDPSAITSLVRAIVTGAADVVVGSRYIDGGGVYGWPLRRLWLSRAGNLYVRILLGSQVHDYTSGFAAFRRSALETIPYQRLASTGFAYLVELKFACRRLGMSITEVPITFRERSKGDSKLSLSIIREALFVTLRSRLNVERLLRESLVLRARLDAAATPEPAEPR